MTGPWIETLAGVGPVYGPQEGDGLAGIVILHGSEGPMAGWGHRFAVILAMHGMLALPVSYGEGDYWGVAGICDVDIGFVEAAVQVLGAHPRCRKAGVFGWSRGGELALLAASLLADTARLPFVAAHAPSAMVRGAFDPDRMRREGWDRPAKPSDPRAWVLPGADARLTPGRTIEIERYPGPVFLSVGDADDIAPPGGVHALAERLAKAGNPADLFIAPGQGHAFDFDTEPQLWARLTAFIWRVT